MSFTETTTTSWFSRLKNGLAGLVIGPLLILGTIWLLSWNEGNSVQTYRALKEGASIVVSVDSTTIDPANQGKLIHASGPVTPNGTPEDADLGVTAQGAAGLTRSVDMYQWVEDSKSETKKTPGGGEETVTTYTYKKEWGSRPVDSSNFRQPDGHENPAMDLRGDRFTVESATVGAFTVDGETVADLGTDNPVRITPDIVSGVEASVGGDRPARANGNIIYVSANRQNPSVGDLRISFTRQDIAQASFVGAQQNGSIVPFKSSNGRNVFLSAAGTETSDEMFKTAQSTNTLITWLIRVAGLVLMFVGFTFAFSILGIIADVIPFVGSIVSFGTSAIAAILTLILGPVVIAIAWIAYRPFVAIAVIAAGVLIAGLIVYRRRAKIAAAPQTPGFGRAA